MQIEEEVKLMDLRGYLRKVSDKSSDENFQLNNEGFKDLIGAYAVRDLIGDETSNEVRMKKKLEKVASPDNVCAVISRKYIQLLLKELPEYSRNKIQDLQETRFNKDSIFINHEIMSFVREHICDVVNLERLYHYGWYVLHHITKEIFSDISKMKIEKFKENMKEFHNSFDDIIEGKISSESKSLGETEHEILQFVFKYEFNKSGMSPIDTMRFGFLFIGNGLKLNQSISKFKNLTKKIINNDNGKRKRYGRKL